MSDRDRGISQSDIAIIGMALRAPGARSVAEFWNNLRNGVESIETRTPEQLLAAGESPANLRRKNYIPRTAELPGLADFDAEFFGMSPKEAAIMDPQHRQFLECAWEALEDSTRTPERMSGPVGVFAGCGMGSYFYFNVLSHRSLVEKVGLFLLRHTGNDKDFLATRASFLFDLHGPSINVQTACSTSLVAVHQACQSLLNGECEMAVAGGVTIELPHQRGYLYQDGEILSADGHCRPFDHRASGTVFGSGTGVVILRRLTDALEDGDPIHAVIKGSAVNNDGASKAGYLAPSVTGQAEAIIEAQTLSGVDAHSIGYVECHGTGTYLGDPIEIEALTQAFRQSTNKRAFCRVGSVKSNIGHLDTAAGVVSLIKTALIVKHGEIPPSLGFEKPNPAIPFADSPFLVADRLVPWPAGAGPRLAAVNSLGVGGTNAHVVIEEPPAIPPLSRSEAGSLVLVLAAKSRKALDATGPRLARYLESNPDVLLQDVSHTLLNGRRHFEQRRIVAVADRADAIRVLANPETQRMFTHSPVDGVPEAVFLFPGGGAQYPHMARTLYSKEPGFRRSVDEGLSYLPPQVATEIREIWLAPAGSASDSESRFLRPSLQLPAILIVEVAIARLWMSWGVKPTALIGHSMGENAAACIAGVLSFERAVGLVHLRGELFEEVSPGGMLSVALDLEALKARLPNVLDIAAINGPELCVVSGPNEMLEAFRQRLVEDGIDATRIPIDIAAHSRMLAPILERFEAFLKASPLAAPTIPIVSNLTGKWLTADEARSPSYWTRHLRSTVRFGDGLALLRTTSSRIFIEVGPGRVLSSLTKAQGTPANQVINSLPHADESSDDHLHFLAALGRAWATGIDIPLDKLSDKASARRVNLPPYAFQQEKYFLQHISTSEADLSETLPVKLPDIANWGWQPIWKQAAPDVRSDAAETPSSWLIFLDGSPIGNDIVARLRRFGHEVSTVQFGDAFGVTAPGAYVLCPESGREGYDALLKHMLADRGLPQRIVHLWLLTQDESFRPGSSFFHRNIELGFMSLFLLGQALADSGKTDPLQITVVTNGMQRVGDEPLRYPEKATVLGPALVLTREMPNISVRVLDIPMATGNSPSVIAREGARLVRRLAMLTADDQEGDVLLEQLWDDLLARNGTEIAAYRNRRRWVRDYDPIKLDQSSDGAVAFREGGVYLVTGGLGGLATACAEDLARRFKARLILVSRTELPPRDKWQSHLATHGSQGRIGRAIAAIQRIEAAGGDVMVAAADITNSEAMRIVITKAKARFGAIHGVLHAAGIVKDDLIPLKSVTDIEEVFAPKVQGTMVLADVLADEPLDIMVLFSSTSTDTAPAGQSDYVAANAFLNAFAESRASQPGRTIALHWGIWKDVGLAARAIEEAESGKNAALTASPARTPLFDRRLHTASEQVFETQLSASRQWVLNEHRLPTGEAILPGTGYIEFAAQALAEQGLDGPFEIQDLTFLRPLYVPNDAVVTTRVTLTRDGADFTLKVESERNAGSETTLIHHAYARINRLVPPRPERIDIDGIVATCRETIRTAEDGQRLASAQEQNLRFGPRWRVLQFAAFGKGEAIASLELDRAFIKDLEEGFQTHPALLDIATGFAMDLIPGYDASRGLWVPMTYGRIWIGRALPKAIWSHARLNSSHGLDPDYATFDVTITDAIGNVVIDVEGFTIKRLAAETNLATSLESEAGGTARTAPQKNNRELSHALQKLAAHVDQGILPEEGFEALVRAIGTGKTQVIVSSMDLTSLQRAATQLEKEDAASATFERPDLGVEFTEPGTEIERTLAGFWSELLGVQTIGTQDNFFDLGGHSLTAVRLIRMIKTAYAVDFPISILFEAQTIRECAALIAKMVPDATAEQKDEGGNNVSQLQPPRLRHAVRMDGGRDMRATPLFLVSGMFGNVLNLRHLAVQLGSDRPVYGLQARGIYGGDAPHETFEEMARDYISEIRTVQPYGPYLIGGFSGGGLVAYEIAQQLRAAGQDTALVVMLDTPYPADVALSIRDKIMMKLQDIQREGVAFPIKWIRRRIAWNLKLAASRRNGNTPKSNEQFHNEEIEAAFRRALSRYRGDTYDGPVLMLRPKLCPHYHVSGGRLLNQDRDLLRADNGWSPLVPDLMVHEVPGDHDSMVLEPHVRVMVSHLRSALSRADRGALARQIAAQ